MGIAALTTVLGMIPLLADVFFASMAVTIMGDLAFAMVRTLLVAGAVRRDGVIEQPTRRASSFRTFASWR